jgi:hypothetical protein
MEDSSANQASLTVLGGPKAGLRFLIEDSVDNIVIGSDPSCRFHIDLPGVSPVHARLWIDPQGVTVYETNSPRGLYVNDDRVVAQASLRNGDILWLGTPGDEEVVMIQCRLPQGKAAARMAPLPIDEAAIDETVALGALPGSDHEAEVAEPEPEDDSPVDVAAEAIVEPELEATPEPEVEPEPEAIAATLADTPSPAAPATEVFMVDESLYGSPPDSEPSAPSSEPAHFEMDFTKAAPSFEEGLAARAPEPTVTMAVPPEPEEAPTVAESPAAPPPPAPPSYPAPAETTRVRERPEPETPAPVRAEPPRPRRTPARPTPAAPPPPVAAQDEVPSGMSPALKYGLLGLGIMVVAVASFVAVRVFRPASAPPQPTAPPTTIAMAPPVTEPPAPAETPPVEASPSAPLETPAPIPEEVVVVPPSAPSPARPSSAPSRPPTPSPRPSPSPRATPKTATPAPTPPPTAAPVQQAASQVAGLLGQAAAAVSARQFDSAVSAYDEVLKLDPQNATATQGKATAQASAASYKRGFAAGRTRLSGKEAKADLGGFETTGVKVAKVPDYSGRIEFEVTPPRVLPGDSYTVRVFLVNDGKKAFKIGSVSVVTLLNGSQSGGPVAVRTREIAPRDRVLLDERTAEWAATTTSWSLEAVVGSDRDATFTNRLNWR